MNYQEAIEILKRNKPVSDLRLCGKELCTACDVAIAAMQELQEYKQYGTASGYKAALMAYDNCYFEKEILKNELYEYRKLGSPEDIRKNIST